MKENWNIKKQKIWCKNEKFGVNCCMKKNWYIKNKKIAVKKQNIGVKIQKFWCTIKLM